MRAHGVLALLVVVCAAGQGSARRLAQQTALPVPGGGSASAFTAVPAPAPGPGSGVMAVITQAAGVGGYGRRLAQQGAADMALLPAYTADDNSDQNYGAPAPGPQSSYPADNADVNGQNSVVPGRRLAQAGQQSGGQFDIPPGVAPAPSLIIGAVDVLAAGSGSAPYGRRLAQAARQSGGEAIVPPATAPAPSLIIGAVDVLAAGSGSMPYGRRRLTQGTSVQDAIPALNTDYTLGVAPAPAPSASSLDIDAGIGGYGRRLAQQSTDSAYTGDDIGDGEYGAPAPGPMSSYPVDSSDVDTQNSVTTMARRLAQHGSADDVDSSDAGSTNSIRHRRRLAQGSVGLAATNPDFAGQYDDENTDTSMAPGPAPAYGY